MAIQSPPEAGGKCIDVPFGQFVVGMRVQMWDCNNGDGQIFIYDEQSQLLKIGPMCVEVWGKGDYGDNVGLGACNGAAAQHWQMVEKNDNYQIIGMNKQCLGIRGASKGSGASLDISPYCNAGPWRLWGLVEAPR
jgi:Ricin-type beta-trefoil lectin domain